MKKLLIILLADSKGHENSGRARHALLYAKQAHEAGIESKLIFDGGGAEWALEMTKKTNKYHPNLYGIIRKRSNFRGM